MCDIFLQLSPQVAQPEGDHRILADDTTDASSILAEENHSISSQNEGLISVSLVPNGEYAQDILYTHV